MTRIMIAMPGNEAFTEQLVQTCNAQTGFMETRYFPDGESYVRILTDVAGKTVDLVCTLARPDNAFLRLIFAADTLRDLGAVEVNLIAPYLAYMRQDKRFQSGESISSLSFAKLLSASFDRLITVDPHLHRYPELASLYTLSTTTLHASSLLADWISSNVVRPLIIGPDEESEQWARAIAEKIHAPHAVLRKVRHGDRNVEIVAPDLSAWRDHQPVLVDDIASSGRTLAVTAQKLTEQGLRKPECVVVHALFAEDAYTQLAPHFSRITSTDAVPHITNRIALSGLIADAIAQNIVDASVH